MELPDAVFDARLDRVRAAMRNAKLDALVIYTNNTRPAGVSWLVGFVPYWSEALLVVPRDGAPYLVAALSFRVKSWIERVSRVGEVLHNPRVGLKAAQQIASVQNNAAVGVVDFDGLPAGIADDMREGGPSLAFSEAEPLFAESARPKPTRRTLRSPAKPPRSPIRRWRQAQGETLNAMIADAERQARLARRRRNLCGGGARSRPRSALHAN